LLVLAPELVEPVHALLDRHVIADDVVIDIAEVPVHRWWGEPAEVWSAPPVVGPPPGSVATADDLEVRRIEAGLPRFGVDVSEANFPFETPLGRLIDHKKGCYVGQEPVARVTARGSAQKQLLGPRVAGGGPAAPGSAIVVDGKPAPVGVTS